MINRILIVLLAIALSGCATMGTPDSILYNYGQGRKLAKAVDMLAQGKVTAATDLLSAICADKGAVGVTDEALIRLSLLRLEAAQDRNSLDQVRHDLERLNNEYPSSSWAPLSSSLLVFIQQEQLLNTSKLALEKETRELRESNLVLVKESKDLRESTLAATRENKELHQSIEKLKNLELEMGRRPKH